MMKLSLYSDTEHYHALNCYSLNDMTYTDAPKNIIKQSQKDKNRYPIVILNENDDIIGFFLFTSRYWSQRVWLLSE